MNRLLRLLGFARGGMPRLLLFTLLAVSVLLAGCSRESLPSVSDLPAQIQDLPGELRNLPGVPESLSELSGTLEELGLPDLSQFTNVPDLDSLPVFAGEPGTVVFRGPSERRINVGEPIPGTDILLVAINDEGAEFQIAGMRSTRVVGDSLDFDGSWPTAPDVDYNVRLRIYYVGSSGVRAAGVHQLRVRNTQPVEAPSSANGESMRFPFATSTDSGQQFGAMTLGYVGSTERGGEISGLPSGDYPYRKVGDSVKWSGQLRPDIGVTYNLRMVNFASGSAQLGGVAVVTLP
jgi:hypothetical protein